MSWKEAVKEGGLRLLKALPRKGSRLWYSEEERQGYSGDYTPNDIDGGDRDPRSTK